MVEHPVYPDELNERGNKTHNGKNKRLAQKHGIVIAQERFNDFLDIDAQGPFFHWNLHSVSVARFAKVQLFMCYRHTPKNIEELKQITYDSVVIEWNNLVSNYDNLPTAYYPYESILETLQRHGTDLIVKDAFNAYKKSLPFFVTSDTLADVQADFNKQFDFESTRKSSFEMLEVRIPLQFEAVDQSRAREALFKYVNDFFDTFKTV